MCVCVCVCVCMCICVCVVCVCVRACVCIYMVRVMAQARPQLIFYQAGVDTLENDKLGKCALTLEGLRYTSSKKD